MTAELSAFLQGPRQAMSASRLLEREYHDATGVRRRVPHETIEAISAVLDDGPLNEDAVRIIRSGTRLVFDEQADLLLEDGRREALACVGRRSTRSWRLPADVPLGYHTVEFHASGRRLSVQIGCDTPPNDARPA